MADAISLSMRSLGAPNKWLERTSPRVTPPARRETQASRHLRLRRSATPLGCCFVA